MSDKKVRFTYLRDKNAVPVACVAFVLTREAKPFEACFGLSVHNPADKWDRTYARELAEQRLNESPHIVRFDSVNAVPTNNEVMSACVETIRRFKFYPRRAKNAANNWFQALWNRMSEIADMEDVDAKSA